MRTDDLKDALRPSQAAWWPPIHDGRTLSVPIRPVRKLREGLARRSMLSTFHDDALTQSSSLLTSWKEVVVESHIELALTSIAHGAQPMARALRRVGGAHRAPSLWAASRATLAFPICGFAQYVS